MLSPCTEQPAADCFGKTTELSRDVCWPWNFCSPTVVIFPPHTIILRFENSAMLQSCFLRRFIVQSYHKVWEKTNHYIVSFFWRARSSWYLGHNKILNYWKVIKHKQLNMTSTKSWPLFLFWCSELPFPPFNGHFHFVSHFFTLSFNQNVPISRLTLVLSCAMNFKNYPHDEQLCNLKIESSKFLLKFVTMLMD